MNKILSGTLTLLCLGLLGCSAKPTSVTAIEPLPTRGPYAVGSTNMEVAPEYADIGDELMHEFLLGRADAAGQPRFVTDILEHPDSAWVIDVPVPDEPALYGPASGQSLPVATFLTYPTGKTQQENSYAFPYYDATYGIFEDMLAPGEAPAFADPDERYPLIIVAHGIAAHGIYDVKHAHDLASHGYIVAVINYGDDRTGYVDTVDSAAFLRPLITKAVVDSLLESETFGDHIDADNIGITGHSFGGFTALAVMGGLYQGNLASVTDSRIKAGVVAAPWVGGRYDGEDSFSFGPDNRALNRVTRPILCLFGTKDKDTLASFILPAMKHLAGRTYVVELVDQPHIFESGSWVDRNNWELLFFSAYLKNDSSAVELLKNGDSMQGGNEDIQLFDYQR